MASNPPSLAAASISSTTFPSWQEKPKKRIFPALDVLRLAADVAGRGRTWVIFGDMLELGTASEAATTAAPLNASPGWCER